MVEAFHVHPEFREEITPKKGVTYADYSKKVPVTDFTTRTRNLQQLKLH